MDSVLTYLVDSSIDPVSELQKSLKKVMNRSELFLFRDLDKSFETVLGSLEPQGGGEVLISALAPVSFYKIIEACNLQPVVLDVELDTGVPSTEDFSKKITDKTILIVNTYSYCVKPMSKDLGELGIPVLEVLLSGLGEDSEGVLGRDSDYSIISLEDSSIISSMGGAILISKESSSDYIDGILKVRPVLKLQGLNASFANSQVVDLSTFFEKERQLIDIYKNSLLKSGYYTYECGDTTSYSFFPVIVKKSLKDIEKYCKAQGVTVARAYADSIIKNISIKASNAKSLSSRTLLFPLSLSMKKNSIELISKILSTLP